MTATGEYAQRGDYHRHLDPHWSYAPIYIRKLRWVDEALEKIPKSAKILDVGAGEGALVERYRGRGWDILGVDSAYESPNVRRADLLSLPFDCGAFDTALCLDVLEHVGLLDQPRALSEIARVLKPGGVFLYADYFPNAKRIAGYLQFLRDLGLDIDRNQNVTANVLMSCDEIAVRRRTAFESKPEDHGLSNFLAIPGSPVYESMKDGTADFRIFRLRKPARVGSS